jgi:ABC-2 type transport system ATP-binding protein
VLSVRLLRKTYRCGGLLRGKTSAVLDGVTFDAHPGEVLGLVGANGTGKTTILHVIAGLVRPDAGWIGFDGETLDAQRAQREVALCSSADRSFYYRLTLRENLRFFGALQGLRGAALNGRIDAALDAMDLHVFADRKYFRCSTGTRQRLTFARALLSDAPIVLLDEPTRAVDPLHAEQLHRFIRATLCGKLGKTVVLATNVLAEAWEACDRIALLSQGRVIDVDTPRALRERFAKRVRYRIEFESLDPAFEARLAEFGDVRRVERGCIDVDLSAGSDPLLRLLREIVDGGSAVKGISSHAPAPHEMFEGEQHV